MKAVCDILFAISFCFHVIKNAFLDPSPEVFITSVCAVVKGLGPTDVSCDIFPLNAKVISGNCAWVNPFVSVDE